MGSKFIAYYRVSTDHQGVNGNGMAAQRKAVEDYLNGGRCKLVGEFTEIGSGKRSDRPELEKALTACRKNRANLSSRSWTGFSAMSISKAARWSARLISWPATCRAPRLYDQRLCPGGARGTPHYSDRTKAGLAEPRPGVSSSAAETRQAGALERARAIAPILSELAGMSARSVAAD
jgi:hypothetical protein